MARIVQDSLDITQFANVVGGRFSKGIFPILEEGMVLEKGL